MMSCSRQRIRIVSLLSSSLLQSSRQRSYRHVSRLSLSRYSNIPIGRASTFRGVTSSCETNKSNNRRYTEPNVRVDKNDSSSSKSVVRTIEQCRNGYDLVKIVSNSSNRLFASDRTAKAVLLKTQQLAPRLKPIDIALLLNRLSKLRYTSTTKMCYQNTISTVANASMHQMKKFKALDLSMTLNALANVNCRHTQFFTAAASTAIPIIDTFTAQSLANTVNAYGKLNYSQYPKVFQAVAIRATSIIHTCNAQELSNLVNAYAKLNHTHVPLFNAVAVAAIPILHTFIAQGLSTTVHAYAKLNHVSPVLFDAVAKASIPIIDTFSTQSLANTVNAFGKLNHPHPDLFNTVATATIARIDTCTALELANILNAFGKLNHVHFELFTSVAQASITIIDTFTSQGLANIVNACAKVNHFDSELLEVVATAFVSMEETAVTSQELANIANAFAKLKYPHDDLFAHIAVTAIPIIDTYTAQELSNTVNAFAKLKYTQYPDLLERIATASLSIIDTFKAQELANTANAFAKLEYPHPVGLLTAIATAAIPILPQFNVQELANTASAFGKVKMTGTTTTILFAGIAHELTIRQSTSISERHWIEVGYAFLKAKYRNDDFLEAMGCALTTPSSNNNVQFNPRELGNLACCFSNTEVASSPAVLTLICRTFQSLEEEDISLQTVADLVGAMRMAQQLNVLSFLPTMLPQLVQLAISKSNECRPEDVKDILLGIDSVDLPNELRLQLLRVYKPYVYQYSNELSPANYSKIRSIYDRLGL